MGAAGTMPTVAETRVLRHQGVELAMDPVGRRERAQLNLEDGGKEQKKRDLVLGFRPERGPVRTWEEHHVVPEAKQAQRRVATGSRSHSELGTLRLGLSAKGQDVCLTVLNPTPWYSPPLGGGRGKAV